MRRNGMDWEGVELPVLGRRGMDWDDADLPVLGSY